MGRGDRIHSFTFRSESARVSVGVLSVSVRGFTPDWVAGMKVVFSAARSADKRGGGKIEIDSFAVAEESHKLYHHAGAGDSVLADEALVGFAPHERLHNISPEQK